jgi:hypothetical protein
LVGKFKAPVIVSPAFNTLFEAVPVTFPVRLPKKDAVTVPAEKFPLASRLTKVLTVLEFVAELAAVAPEATFAAERPPTVATVVADWVPFTSPEREPVKLEALKVPVILPAERVPVTRALPITSKVDPGVVVPIPTLPADVIRILSEGVVEAPDGAVENVRCDDDAASSTPAI